jgi:glutamine amidotransferase
MCRVLGSVATEPVSLRHELLDAENPLVRQSELNDSGWGMAVYRRAEGGAPDCVRFPEAAFADDDFVEVAERRGRIVSAHVRRATMGGLTEANTHPFCMGNYSFAHNGTVFDYTRLLEEGVRWPEGETDSEAVFNFILRGFDCGDVIGSLRRAISGVVARSAFSALNFLFSDGERLYAYRLGVFELHWLARPGRLLVASEKLSDEPWHSVQQDVLLALDPEDPAEPHAERLLGDELVRRAVIAELDDGLSSAEGEERGRLAAERAARTLATARG